MVIDRLLVKPGIERRLATAVEAAMKLADGLVLVAVVDGEERLYSSKLACPECGINVPVLEPRSFSFNSMYGACPECNGLGSKYDFDPAKVIERLVEAAAGWRPGPGFGIAEPDSSLQLAAEAYGFDLGKPFEQLPQKTQNLILYGPEAGEKKKRGGFLGVFAYLRQSDGGQHLGRLSRVAAGPHVGHEVPGVRGPAAATGEPGGEGERHVHCRLHGAARIEGRYGCWARSS